MKTIIAAGMIAVSTLVLGACKAEASEINQDDFLRIINAGMLDHTEMHCRDIYTSTEAASEEIVSVYLAVRDDALRLAAFETGRQNVDNWVRQYGVSAVCETMVTEYFPALFK